MDWKSACKIAKASPGAVIKRSSAGFIVVDPKRMIAEQAQAEEYVGGVRARHPRQRFATFSQKETTKAPWLKSLDTVANALANIEQRKRQTKRYVRTKPRDRGRNSSGA